MKRTVSALLALMLLIAAMTAAATPADEIITYGPFTYDASDAVEMTSGEYHTLIRYQEHLVLLRYVPLAAEGFDQDLLSAALDTSLADSEDVALLFLEGLYMDSSDDPFYEEFAIDDSPGNYSTMNTILYNGIMADEESRCPMAGICFVDNEGLLLVEAISVLDEDPAAADVLRSEAVALVRNEGRPVFATVAENTLTMGSFTFDLSGCDSYTLDGSYLVAEYGSRTLCLEHAYFSEFGATFEIISQTLGTFSYESMAKLLFEMCVYDDYKESVYRTCRIDETEIITTPDGIMFSGVLDDEHGGRRVAGFILVTDSEIIYEYCIDGELGVSIASTENFRTKILNKLTYEGEPVIK